MFDDAINLDVRGAADILGSPIVGDVSMADFGPFEDKQADIPMVDMFSRLQEESLVKAIQNNEKTFDFTGLADSLNLDQPDQIVQGKPIIKGKREKEIQTILMGKDEDLKSSVIKIKNHM